MSLETCLVRKWRILAGTFLLVALPSSRGICCPVWGSSLRVQWGALTSVPRVKEIVRKSCATTREDRTVKERTSGPWNRKHSSLYPYLTF